MPASDRDLFDDSTMSFGEHLEELRERVLKSLYGIILGSIVGLFFGGEIIGFVRAPLDKALRDYQYEAEAEMIGAIGERDFGDWLWGQLGFGRVEAPDPDEPTTADVDMSDQDPAGPEEIVLRAEIDAADLAAALREVAPSIAIDDDALAGKTLTLPLRHNDIGRFRAAADQIAKPVTLGVPEAFMTYVKVSIIAGVLLASPWIFYQAWLFVAAGLYPHERAWVKRYGWISFLLFFVGIAFCYYVVLPFVLRFMLGFNRLLEINPQIQLTQWISFATILPLVFGVSFQLPIVMLFLERIQVFTVRDYYEKWRIAVLVIAVVSMLVTPTDPTSMLAMMLPLCLLYFLGIKMCEWSPATTPFDDAVEVESRKATPVG